MYYYNDMKRTNHQIICKAKLVKKFSSNNLPIASLERFANLINFAKIEIEET